MIFSNECDKFSYLGINEIFGKRHSIKKYLHNNEVSTEPTLFWFVFCGVLQNKRCVFCAPDPVIR